MDRASGYATLSNGLAKMAANLYILSPGSPFIYYGEEIGIKGSRGGANSDANRRVAMLWGDDDTIKDPIETTYDPTKQTNGTVVEQKKDQESLYNHYKKLIMIRNAYPEIARGTYKAISSSEKTLGGFTVTYNNSTVCVIHNTNKTSPLQYDLSKITEFTFTTIATYIGNDGVTLENGILTISPQTTVILK
jgi:glycosidase